ncbi:MAG: GGDEF domain-containing protein [Defluviitaleaceae bacterium]|nr:GGDEF domain-containing protein [Defluviitaleaceae bacterium]
MQHVNISDSIHSMVFDKLPVFVIVFCQEGKVLFCNKLAEVACGKQIRSLKFSDIFAHEYRSDGDETTELKYECRIGGNYYSIVDFHSKYTDVSSASDAINARVLVGYDITDVKNYVFNHNNRSILDSMTEVFNREVGMNFLKEMIAQVEIDQDFFSIAYIDFDNLKFINDNFGHIEGDKYIFAVCDAIHSFIRKEDIVSRMGGDEFLIIFPRFTYEDTRKVLAAITEKLDIVSADLSEGISYRISYGVYEVNPSVPLDVEHILKQVDDAMYIMKAENKTNYGLQIRLT